MLPIKTQEIWFNSQVSIPQNVDIVFYYQVASGLPQHAFYTLLIDLQKPNEELFQEIKKNFRYEINRATEKDNLTIYYYDSNNFQDKNIKKFTEDYQKFAIERNKNAMSLDKVLEQVKAGVLVLSQICNQDETLVWHSYVVIGNRVRLKTSSSLYVDNQEKRNLIGRANKLLHWKDILFFKEKGYLFYDFGGWYNGNSDKKLLGINAFKEAFGGYREQSYTFTKALTLKGKLYLKLSYIKNKLQQLIAR